MARTHLICLLVVISMTSSSSSSSSREQEEDRIKELPGQPKVGFSQFSGYVTVNESHGRSLFYWLTESSSSPHTKPLLLWLNGGPGCSSIAYGASEEIGPFRIDKTGYNLYLNKFPWNTAKENLIFLIKWMSRFPQYQYRDFYIAGESYAGHYVPQLAKKIHNYNKDLNKKAIINLKGFMVGNGDTDKHYDRLGAVTYWWSHAMISDRSYSSILKYCSFTTNSNSDECNISLYNATIVEFGQVNGYSIYSPSCIRQTNETKFPHRRILAEEEDDPCTESYAEIYYNRPDVQRAMHVKPTFIPYNWTACNQFLFHNLGDSDYSMLPIYKELMDAGLRIWVSR